MKKHFYALLIASGLATAAGAQCWQVGNGTSGGVTCMLNDTTHHCLYMGGGYHSGNDSLHYCNYWNDTAFFPMGNMMNNGTNDSVWCFVMFNGNLYVGGSFTQAGGNPVNHVAAWNGSSWNAVGNGFNAPVRALAVYNNELYAGGDFTLSGSTTVNHVAKWNGSQWIAAGSGVDGAVFVLCPWQNQLCMGGDFTHAGNNTVNHICSWDGMNYNAFGTGMSSSPMHPCSIYSMCPYGDSLFVGGQFHGAGNCSVHNLACWNGSSWLSAGNIGSEGDGVYAMCMYNHQLCVGGYFSSCSSSSANNICMWNGMSWSTIGTGINGRVDALEVYNGKLYLGGSFTNADGTPAANIASYSVATGMQTMPLSPGAISVYPNPSESSFNVSWTQDEAATVTITAFDAQGRQVAQETQGFQSAGNHTTMINTANWEKGIYLLSVQAGNNLQRVKIMVQ